MAKTLKALPHLLGKKNDKGEQEVSMIKVTNAVRNKKKNEAGEEVSDPLTLEFEASRIQVPQFESIADFVADCGGETKALEVLNDVTEKAAASTAKAKIRTTTTGTPEEMIQAGINAAANFTWAETETLSAKEVKSRVDDLAARVKAGSISSEELAAYVLQLAGK